MLERVAKRITSFFIAKNWIAASDAELSIYMLQCKLLRSGSIVVLVCVGSLLQGFAPTGLFLFCFLSARKRSGGYHAKTSLRCLLLSVSIVALTCEVFVPMLASHIIFWSLALLAFAMTTFCMVGTVNHPAMHLTRSEMKESKKRLVVTTSLEAMVILLILALFGTLHQWALSMALGLAFAASSTIVAKLAGQEVKQTYG